MGASLDPGPPHQSPARKDGAAGERRQLTVLFADLVGSSELAAGMDPEDWRDVVQRYQRGASEVVARFGGHVAQYLGDGLLAYFGWPQAHEDAPERAVRAGLVIVEGAAAVPLPAPAVDASADVARGARTEPRAASLQVRVGIHTGPVVVGEIGGGGRAEMLALGETPNLAARVQAASAADTVMITAATSRLVSGLFLVEDRGSQPLKGAREPVQLYRVVGPSGLRGRVAAAAEHGLTPFVGREDQRQLLRERFEQARAGEGQVVLLVGEAGIGKSRLAQMLRGDLAGRPHTWLESGGAPYATSTPFYAVAGLLGQLFAWQAGDPPEARVAALERALAAAGLELPDAVPLVAPLLALPVPAHYPPVWVAPELARKRLLATLAAWTLGAARQQPMVILLEDLQWLDPSTLELQQILVEQCATTPLLLVYTARPDFRPPWPLWAHHTQLTLSRLPRQHVRSMVAQVAIRTTLQAELVEAVVTRTDGVPLFVEELTKALAEAGAAAAALRNIPDTLQDSLMARLDRLGAEAREVAQVGAVCGREFSWRLLAAVQPLASDALEAALVRLCDAELVYVRGRVPEAVYSFKHALVQDAAYQALLKSRRRELHARVAAALAEHFPDLTAAQPELLAQHWSEAGEYRRAVEAWRQAGEHASERGAADEAERHLRRGLGLLALLPAGRERDADEFRIQLLLGYALLRIHGFGTPEAATAYGRAQALSEGLGEAPQIVLMLMGSCLSTLGREGAEAARPLADQALTVAERAGQAPLLVWTHFAQGLLRHHVGDLRGACEHLVRGRGFYDEATAIQLAADPLVGLLVFEALTLAARGLPDQARARSRDALGWAQRSKVPGAPQWAHMYTAILQLHLREPDMAFEHLDALAKGGLEVNFGEKMEVEALRSYVLAVRGALAQGIAALRRCINDLLERGTRNALEFYLGLLADVVAKAGDLHEALRILGEAEGILPGASVFRPETLRRRADLLARRAGAPAGSGGAREIEATFRAALDLALAQDARLYALRAATGCARWLRVQGRAEEGHALLAPLYSGFSEGFDTLDLREAKALLDALGGGPETRGPARSAAPPG